MSKRDDLFIELISTKEIFDKLGIRPRHSGRVYDTSKEKLPTVPLYRPKGFVLPDSKPELDEHKWTKNELDNFILNQLKKESENMGNMKFKAGDPVKVIKVRDGFTCSERAAEYIGKEGKIVRVCQYESNQFYTLDVDGGLFKWFEDELALIPQSPKSLLKDGVVATFRDGREWILLKDDFLQGYCKVSINRYDKDLEHMPNEPEYDIMKLEFDGEVIWERPIKKGTMTYRSHFISKEEVLKDLETFLNGCDEEELEITIKRLEVKK